MATRTGCLDSRRVMIAAPTNPSRSFLLETEDETPSITGAFTARRSDHGEMTLCSSIIWRDGTATATVTPTVTEGACRTGTVGKQCRIAQRTKTCLTMTRRSPVLTISRWTSLRCTHSSSHEGRVYKRRGKATTEFCFTEVREEAQLGRPVVQTTRKSIFDGFDQATEQVQARSSLALQENERARVSLSGLRVLCLLIYKHQHAG